MPYLAFGLVPPHAGEKHLANVLYNIIGRGRVNKEHLFSELSKVYGYEALNKFRYAQKKYRGFLKHDKALKSYRLRYTLPAKSKAQVVGIKEGRDADLEQYGKIPVEGLRRKLPGQPYSVETDETRAFIMKVNPNITDEDFAREFRRVARNAWEYRPDGDDYSIGKYYPRPVKAPKQEVSKSCELSPEQQAAYEYVMHGGPSPFEPEAPKVQLNRFGETSEQEAVREAEQAAAREKYKAEKAAEAAAREAAELAEKMRIAAIEDAERLRKWKEAQEAAKAELAVRKAAEEMREAEEKRIYEDEAARGKAKRMATDPKFAARERKRLENIKLIEANGWDQNLPAYHED